MIDPWIDATTIFIAAVFALAGVAKGVIGLGLPPIAMGLLAVVMAPVDAAAILLLRSSPMSCRWSRDHRC